MHCTRVTQEQERRNYLPPQKKGFIPDLPRYCQSHHQQEIPRFTQPRVPPSRKQRDFRATRFHLSLTLSPGRPIRGNSEKTATHTTIQKVRDCCAARNHQIADHVNTQPHIATPKTRSQTWTRLSASSNTNTPSQVTCLPLPWLCPLPLMLVRTPTLQFFLAALEHGATNAEVHDVRSVFIRPATTQHTTHNTQHSSTHSTPHTTKLSNDAE